MSIVMNGIDVPNTIVDLEFRIIQLEIITQLLVDKLPPNSITKQEASEVNVKAKQLLHKKYPLVKIEN